MRDHRSAMDAGSLARSIADDLKFALAKNLPTATAHDRFWSTALAVRDRLVDRWIQTQRTYFQRNVKRVYYLSMEYLIGRSLRDSLLNLGLDGAFERAARELGYPLADLLEVEPDAALGNGGLGRLAACFLDSMATLQLPATGYGLRYEFGMFRQVVRDAAQAEEPDTWLRLGNPWEISRPERTYAVRFGGSVVTRTDATGRVHRSLTGTHDLLAMAHDLPVPGYRNNTVNNLRLWAARASDLFDLDYFNSGDYIRAVERRARSENVTKILYPNDQVYAGQQLRLRQEYFLASASIQDIVRRYRETNASFDVFADKVAIQINDTHPAVAVAELMRLLVDEAELEWDEAWQQTTATFGYTNHTLMSEALEKWPVELFGTLLPRHLEIVYEINHRFLDSVARRWAADPERLRRVSLIEEEPIRQVRMAHLAVVGSHSTNGVSELHSRLLQERVLPDFAACFPDRFSAKTNGISPRRWLAACNPDLARLITQAIGDGWQVDLDRLQALAPLADDAAFRAEWRAVKQHNRTRLVEAIARLTGVRCAPDALMDVQVKRIHEYKRQLLNLLRVIDLWQGLRSGDFPGASPRTVVFGGKAAPGYAMAKTIIELALAVAAAVERDSAVGDRLKVVFLEDYRVSLAEIVVPGTDLSEQISTAGTEASGTGNMKFALNGALTIGTLDGANIEMREEIGDPNMFIFGATAAEVGAIRAQGYAPARVIASVPRLAAAIDQIDSGLLAGDRGRFRAIVDSLRHRDPYLVCADFAAYCAAQERVDIAWRHPESWTRASIFNAAGMGKFSSDRTIAEYAREIWGTVPCPVELG